MKKSIGNLNSHARKILLMTYGMYPPLPDKSWLPGKRKLKSDKNFVSPKHMKQLMSNFNFKLEKVETAFLSLLAKVAH